MGSGSNIRRKISKLKEIAASIILLDYLERNEEEKPIFDYQKLLYDNLLIPNINNPLHHDFKHKHLWVRNATGLGVPEFFLRLMVWLCLKDDTYRNSQMCVVTGSIENIPIKLI